MVWLSFLVKYFFRESKMESPGSHQADKVAPKTSRSSRQAFFIGQCYAIHGKKYTNNVATAGFFVYAVRGRKAIGGRGCKYI
jgi:hypothetical protein